MIRINLNSKTKSVIEKIVIDDARRANTGVIKLLQRKALAARLQKDHIKIYNLLYDSKGVLKEDELVKLLLADKEQMISYIGILGKYDKKPYTPDADDLLEKYFRYDTFCERKVIYEILEKIDTRVCPYCNRQYIFSIKKNKIRPQFDHYFPKSEYPYLALSIWNLIPSCSICNMSKSSLNTVSTPILYPYEEEFGEDVVFRTKVDKGASFTKYVHGLTDEFEVQICDLSGKLSKKVTAQNKILHLEELYNEHKDYIMDIAKNHYINTDKRVNELFLRYPLLFGSKEDVRSLVYMNDIRKENWGKRPLAKLTRDIYWELEEN